VINMSLGSPFGRASDPSAVAATNAAAAGIVVVASAGNSGSNPYITGAPAAGDGVISVAAIDSSVSFPAARLGLSSGSPVTAINANGADLPAGPLPIHVLRNPDGTVSLGCNGIGAGGEPLSGSTPGEYGAQNVAGKIVVTLRGGCARVARAVHAQQAGAAGVIMIDTSVSFPPFEGEITDNPDIPGHEYPVTIPFLGVRGVLGPGATEDADRVVAADGSTTTLDPGTLANPGFRRLGSFSSGGPRNGDSAAKPNVAAPGVSILSTAAGTGSGGKRISGTSMASPHVAGVAALVRESHPDWSVEDVSAALQNSADPPAVDGYRLTRAGSGLVDAAQSVSADVVALGDGVVAEDAEGNPVGFPTASLNFGFAELGADYSGTRTLTVRNHGGADVTLTLDSEPSPQSRPASIALGATSVTVPAGGQATVDVTLNVAAATVGGTFATNQFAFREVSGTVTLTSGERLLRVPYLLVPRALSNAEASLDGPLTASGVDRHQSATVTNEGGTLTTAADVFAWGLEDPDDLDEGALGGGGYDVRAVGAQSFDAEEALGDRAYRGDRLLVFAVNNWSRWSTAAVNEWDINVDSNGDGSADHVVVAFDSGAIRTGTSNGLLEVFFVDNATGDLFASGFLATAPTDSSTLLMPILASDLGLSNASRQLAYSAVSFSREGAGFDAVDAIAGFNAFKPAVTTGQFVTVAPDAEASFAVEVDSGEWGKTPAIGLMIVALDNAAGASEAQLIPVPAP
jgi:subtilisin family serine protease